MVLISAFLGSSTTVSFAQSKSFFVTKSGNRRLSPSGQVVRHEDKELVQGIEHDRGDIVHTEPEPRMNAQVRLRWYCEAHLIRLNPGLQFLSDAGLLFPKKFHYHCTRKEVYSIT